MQNRLPCRVVWYKVNGNVSRIQVLMATWPLPVLPPMDKKATWPLVLENLGVSIQILERTLHKGRRCLTGFGHLGISFQVSDFTVAARWSTWMLIMESLKQQRLNNFHSF
ncbi:hypothetical protein X975_25132, partial [Stegodyphus mimosarum]